MASLEARFLSSDGACEFSHCAEHRAREWISSQNTREEVIAIFDALRGLVARSLGKVAAEWNTANDLTRVLPAELREACFAPLTGCDVKARLSLVCSSWRSSMPCLPAVWKDLTFRRWSPFVDSVLVRSGQLPHNLCLDGTCDSAHWEVTLGKHASRIKRLSIAVNTTDSGSTPALEFRLPVLEELSLRTESMNDGCVSEFFLGQDAPCLRTLVLSDLSVPPVCPAFAHVTTLFVEGGEGTIGPIFEVMPRLEHLEVGPSDYYPQFPRVPTSSRLRVLGLTHVPTSIDDIVSLGYTRVQELTISLSLDWRHIIEAAVQFPNLPSELRVTADGGEIALYLYPFGGGIFKFAVESWDRDVLQTLLCTSGAAFSTLKKLVLPASLGREIFPGQYVPVLLETAAHLPALERLCIECARSHNPGDARSSPEFLLGRIHAPELRSISVVAARNAFDFCALEHVAISHLMSFITNTLVCENIASIEVFFDTEHGLLLDGDLAQLRTFVGNVYM